MPNVTFTLKDINGVPLANTAFKICAGFPDEDYDPLLPIPAEQTVTTDLDGEVIVDLQATTAPYYISKATGTVDEHVAYKFFVPDVTSDLNADFIYVDLGLHQRLLNDAHLVTLIDAKVNVMNRMATLDSAVVIAGQALAACPAAIAASADAVDAAALASAAAALYGVDVRTHGAVNGGSTTANETAFLAAVAAAIANKSYRVYIPFDSFPFRSWSVTNGIDAQGCVVVGNGSTSLVGMIGAARMEGCVLNTSEQDYVAVHPVIPYDSAKKLVKMYDANTLYMLVNKPTPGYAWMIFKNNETTAGSDSLATATNNTTMWRVTAILDAVECLCGITTKTDKSNVSGTGTDWSNISLTTDVPTHDSGTYYAYTRSTHIGAWAQYQVTVPEDGFLSIAFLESAGASDDVTITMAATAGGAGLGVGTLDSPVTTLDANFTIVSATTRRVTRTYTVKPGVWVIRVTNNTAGSTGLNIIGLYFTKLKNARNDIAYDAYGTYRNDAVNIAHIQQSSANDFVVKDYDSVDNGDPGIYGGSYHGGESGITSSLFVDNVSKTITSGALYVGSSVELQQNCTIAWAGAKSGCTYSGASVTVHTRTTLLIGGYAHVTTMTGALTVSEVYPTLFGINKLYTAITYPQYKVLSAITDGTMFSLGQNNAVEYLYAPSGQKLRITHSTFTCPDSMNGGAYIWRVASTYNKYYNPWVWRGKRSINSIAATNIVQIS